METIYLVISNEMGGDPICAVKSNAVAKKMAAHFAGENPEILKIELYESMQDFRNNTDPPLTRKERQILTKAIAEEGLL